MKLKNAILITGALGGVSYLSYQAIGDQMLKRVFSRIKNKFTPEEKYMEWLTSSSVTQVKVGSFDGLKLCAYNVHNHEDNRYMILVHGISSDKTLMYERAYEFDKLGYNLLIIDQRSAGDSEGQYCTYGFKESQDLQIWINYLCQKYADVKICLYGISMGAATIMMASAYELPENVKCLIEDCGYSSLKEELAYIIRKDYKLALPGPVLNIIEKKMKERFGMSFDDISPKNILESNEIPILFIHGEKDEVVPFDMAKICYNHNKGIKKYYAVEDAGHIEAYKDPDYYKNLDVFMKEYM